MNERVFLLRCRAEPALVEFGDVVMALRVREKAPDLIGDLRESADVAAMLTSVPILEGPANNERDVGARDRRTRSAIQEWIPRVNHSRRNIVKGCCA